MKFPLRAAAFAALTVIPFLRFLVENHFSLLRSDSVAAAALFGVPALLFAACGRRTFVPLLIACSLVVASDSFRQQLTSLVSLSSLSATALLLVILSLAAYGLGNHFPKIVILFSASFFAGEFLRTPLTVRAAQGAQHHPGHVLYIVLDGHIGIAGFPTSIAECVRARDNVQRTLDSHQFTTYANATSNYGVTLLSIPSILNQQLLATPEQFTGNHTAGGATIVSPNQLFTDYASRGYRVAVYQHRSINYTAGSKDVHQAIEYSSEISGLELVPNWGRRVFWLVGDYQGSAPLLSRARGFLPFHAGFRRTGALAVRSVWPGPLADDILRTPERSLFFVHLLVPHEPYVYRADGAVRDPSEWTSDTPVPPLDPGAYQTRFAAYCEQVSALSGQLNGFLELLRSGGALNTMTVVIHGDHGSRIYLKGGDRRTAWLNQFSALLAMRAPAARAAALNQERASLITLLARDFRGKPIPGSDADSLFWVDEAGIPSEISLQELWR